MTSESPPSQISYLIRLLDDSDPQVWHRVRDHLVALGAEAVPFLEMAQRSENLVLRDRCRQVLNHIAPRTFSDRFRKLARTSPGKDVDLEEGVLLLMKYGHPESDVKEVTRTLDELAKGLASRLPATRTAPAMVKHLVDYLFHEQGFAGNQDNYFLPDNTYFDTVLRYRTGIPITLSTLSILVGQRLDLPIVGVGLPCHFIVKYDCPYDPLFFDPFHRGRLLSPEDCADLVRSFGVEFEEQFLAPVGHRQILIRMIHNLINLYQRLGESEKVDHLTGYARILMNRE